VAELRASGRPAWIVFGLGVAGALLLVAAEFSNLRHTSVITATCQDFAGADKSKCSATGGQHHAYALLPLAILVLAMSWGAAVRRARPAAAALIAVGAVVIAIAIAFDLPDTRKAGAVGADFADAKEHAGPAIPLEVAGAVLLIAGGLVGLRRRDEAEPG
jgi:hypothetical protein